MSFEWYKIYKHENNIEADVTDRVYDYVCEYYGLENIEELTEEQIEEVRAFADELNEYSPMMMGFNNLFHHLEDLEYENSVG